MRLSIPWIEDLPGGGFPDPETALREPDGLLAAGGDLSTPRLMAAYRQGIFPWFSEGQPPLWWCPDPRTVFSTARTARSRRFRRGLRGCTWQIRADTCFDAVIDLCARVPRAGQRGTWITGGMLQAYRDLHALGHAHSVEVFDGDLLVGGIYGVSVGRMFFGESMFSAVSGGSKVALAGLAHRLQQWGWPLIDAQVENPHLMLLGAEAWPRSRFLEAIRPLIGARPEPAGRWTDTFGTLAASELAG